MADKTVKVQVSGLVTCFNEEHQIARCIESLLWCEEIIVVDSYSTDRTPEIARSYDKVKFFQHPYFGGAAQKNWALQHVTHEWICLLDADEVCTPALREEIQALLQASPPHSAYTIHRNVFFLGKRIRYSGWQHDRVIRFFRRGTAYYQNRRVHSRLITTGPAPILRNSIEHHMVDQSFYAYTQQIAKYGYWGAAQAWQDGKRCRGFELIIRPLWRFLRTYVLSLGFLDGARGIVFCLLQAYATYIKLSVLWGWQVNQARGIPPDLPEFDEEQETWQGLAEIESKR